MQSSVSPAHVARPSERFDFVLTLLLHGLLAVLSLCPAYAGQELARTWYFLHLDLGPAWQTTVTLTNPEAQRAEVNLSRYDPDGGFVGEIPTITGLEAETTHSLEVEKVLAPFALFTGQ